MSAFWDGFITGGAKQLTKEIEESQARINTIVDRAADFQIKDYITKKDARDKKVEVLKDLTKDLAARFGDDPLALEKAASIVSKGTNFAEGMLEKFKKGEQNLMSANEIYRYTPDPDGIGIDRALLTADKIAEMAVPEVEFDYAAPTGSEQLGTFDSIFGGSVKSKYKQRISAERSVGLIPGKRDDDETELAFRFGTGEVDYAAVGDVDFKDRYMTNKYRMQGMDPSSPEYKRLQEDNKKIEGVFSSLDKFKTGSGEGGARVGGGLGGTPLTESGVRQNFKDFMNSIDDQSGYMENDYGASIIMPDGSVLSANKLTDPDTYESNMAKIQQQRNAKAQSAAKQFLESHIGADGSIADSGIRQFVRVNPTARAAYDSILADLQAPEAPKVPEPTETPKAPEPTETPKQGDKSIPFRAPASVKSQDDYNAWVESLPSGAHYVNPTNGKTFRKP